MKGLRQIIIWWSFKTSIAQDQIDLIYEGITTIVPSAQSVAFVLDQIDLIYEGITTAALLAADLTAPMCCDQIDLIYEGITTVQFESIIAKGACKVTKLTWFMKGLRPQIIHCGFQSRKFRDQIDLIYEGITTQNCAWL